MRKNKYNKWIVIILCLAMIWPQGLAMNTLQVLAATTGTITATSLNVRSGPGTSYSKVQIDGNDTYLKKGEQVTIIEEEDGWYIITFTFSGKTVQGYVMDDYVNIDSESAEPTVTPTVTPTPTPTADKVNITTADFKIPATVVATSLNVRKTPSTSAKKLASLAKSGKVTVLNEVILETGKWYRISYKTTSKTSTGYVLSDYIKLTLSTSVKANVDSSKAVKIRTGAGESSKYLTNKAGTKISLKDGKSVTITKEVTDKSSNKWFKVSFTVSSVKYSGYILADQVLIKVTETVATPTANPTPSAKPNTTPTPTTKPNTTPTVTPTPKITSVPTPTPFGYVQQVTTPTEAKIYNVNSINIIKNILASTDVVVDVNYSPLILAQNQKITIQTTVQIGSEYWYYISVTISGTEYFGYVKSDYVQIGAGGNQDGVPIVVTPTVTVTPAPGNTLTDAEFEASLISQGFPESYKPYLRTLHQQYPTWIFQAYQTGLDWNTVITKEGAIGINLISNGKTVEWKSLESGAYNWKTDSFIPFDGSTWVTASKAAISYYMDPRNFLTEKAIFQFELLSFQSAYQNTTGVEGIFYNTPLYNTYYSYLDDAGVNNSYTYAQTFVKAAEYSGVSPYHLAARVKQEVVTGTTSLSSSVSGTVSGWEGLYNFYNIGAYHSTEAGGAVANGLKFAKNGTTDTALNALYKIPWDNPYDSIVGGAYNIGRNYINRGQNTIYLQKFNATPTSTYSHQYMANVEAPNAEAKKTFEAYTGMMNVPIVFSIPVFSNMPATTSPVPATAYNPNNWLKTLVIDGYNLTPTFDLTVDQTYSLIVGNTVGSINVAATTVSKKSSVIGTGVIPLQVGNNQVILTVIAENGSSRQYVINVVREALIQ